MKQIVIFRTNSRFNMVTPKEWNKSAKRFEESVQQTARTRRIPEETFNQFKNREHRQEVQNYLRAAWQG